MESVANWIFGLLGWIGLPTLYAIVVRPRVYHGVRSERAVRTVREDQLDRVEKVLLSNKVPTGLCEVEWWNEGRHTADSVEIEVKLPVDISAWEVTPPADDLAGPWRCTKDPLGPDADKRTIVIRQEELKPDGSFRMAMGFQHPPEEVVPAIRAYMKRRKIPRSPSEASWFLFAVFSAIVVASFVAAGRMASALDAWVIATFESKDSRQLAALVLLVAIAFGPLALSAWVYEKTRPRKPSWLAPPRK